MTATPTVVENSDSPSGGLFILGLAAGQETGLGATLVMLLLTLTREDFSMPVGELLTASLIELCNN